MYFRPPGFSKEKGGQSLYASPLFYCRVDCLSGPLTPSAAEWEAHPEVAQIMQLQREGLTSRAQPPGSSGVEGGGEEEERVPVPKPLKRRRSKRENKFALLMEMEDMDL